MRRELGQVERLLVGRTANAREASRRPSLTGVTGQGLGGLLRVPAVCS